MKKRIGIVGMIVIGTVFAFTPGAFSQETKEAVTQMQSQDPVASNSSSYIIGAEDKLYIHVWKEDALTNKDAHVRSDGKISLPLIDEIQAAGLTPLQLKAKIVERLKEFVENPVVSVMVVESNSHKVYVLGQVKTPGVQRLKAETSLLQLIPMVGGFTEWANQKKILVIRKENGNEKRITVNYKKLMNGKEPGSNLILKPGDTIIVP